jgi:hypothetical protein
LRPSTCRGSGAGSLPDTNLGSTQSNGIFYIRNVSPNNFVNITVSLAGFTFPSPIGASSYADAVTEVGINGMQPTFNLTTNITGSGSINNIDPQSPSFSCSSPSPSCGCGALMKQAHKAAMARRLCGSGSWLA